MKWIKKKVTKPFICFWLIALDAPREKTLMLAGTICSGSRAHRHALVGCTKRVRPWMLFPRPFLRTVCSKQTWGSISVSPGKKSRSISAFSVHVKALQSCLTLCSPMDSSPSGSSVPGILQARITGVGCHFLLQGIFPTQGLNPGLPHCRQTSRKNPGQLQQSSEYI